MEFVAPEEPTPGARDRPDAERPRESSGSRPVDAAFAAPDGTEWSRVSPAFVRYRRALLLAVLLPGLIVGSTVVGSAFGWVGGVVWFVALAALATSGWFLAAAAGRAWGYAEGRTDFYITRGAVVRQLVVVPYGRMQLVDVMANPLEQWLGIATVRVHTAATTVEAYVSGLPLEEANRLRDRLALRSETFSTGL